MFVPLMILMLMKPTILEAARALTDRTQARYWLPDRRRYAAYVTESGKVAKAPAFAWDVAVELSALAAAMRFDRARYEPLFDQAQASLDSYGSDFKGVFGYGVLPNQAHPDRFYDDNEWIALAQMDAYSASHSRRYLKGAEKTFAFALSGLTSDLGGGIFWREQEKKSKNTCSTAPAILAAAKLYEATKNDQYLRTAESLHQWIERLKDPSDSLMFDSVDLQGHVQHMKWTYNTALMISADVELFRITKDSSYRGEALAMGRSAIAHWVDPSSGAIHDEGPFAHHLAEALLDLGTLDPTGPWKATAKRAVEFAYQNTGSDRLFGLRWDRYEVRDHRLILLYQASMARALWDLVSSSDLY